MCNFTLTRIVDPNSLTLNHGMVVAGCKADRKIRGIGAFFMYRNRLSRMLLVLLLMFSFAVAVPVASGQRRYRRHNPEAGKKKAAKRIGIGTAVGAGAGALIGGRKGALIGAGAGAGAGTVYHYHKKRQYRHRHRRP
jgi:YMGG-like Gly-zipper